MNPKEYIVNQLKMIQGKIPELSFRYAFDDRSSMHIIEVKPEEIYNVDKIYAELESDFIFDFDNKFYPESILFISEKSLVKINNVEIELNSKLEAGYLLSDLLVGELTKMEIGRCLLQNDLIRMKKVGFRLEHKAGSVTSNSDNWNKYSGQNIEELEEECGENYFAFAA